MGAKGYLGVSISGGLTLLDFMLLQPKQRGF